MGLQHPLVSSHPRLSGCQRRRVWLAQRLGQLPRVLRGHAALDRRHRTIVTDRREIAADAYFKGLFETSLDPGELILRVRFPLAEKSAYAKFPNPASRYAMVGVFVARGGETRVAATGAYQAGVTRIPEFERALSRNFAPEALAKLRIASEGLMSDVHADAAYRAQLLPVMAMRAVASAG